MIYGVQRDLLKITSSGPKAKLSSNRIINIGRRGCIIGTGIIQPRSVVNSPRLLQFDGPKGRSGRRRHEEEHAQHGDELEQQSARAEPSVAQLPPRDESLTILFRKRPQFEVSPMVEGSGAISSQDEEHWRSRDRDQIEGQEQDEFGNLAKREGRVEGRSGGFPELLERVLFISLVKGAGGGDEILKTLIDEDGIEDVDERFIDEEGFE